MKTLSNQSVSSTSRDDFPRNRYCAEAFVVGQRRGEDSARRVIPLLGSRIGFVTISPSNIKVQHRLLAIQEARKIAPYDPFEYKPFGKASGFSVWSIEPGWYVVPRRHGTFAVMGPFPSRDSARARAQSVLSRNWQEKAFLDEWPCCREVLNSYDAGILAGVDRVVGGFSLDDYMRVDEVLRQGKGREADQEGEREEEERSS